jgi:cytidylate kinase
MKLEIGLTVKSSKLGLGTITKIITKSTGYVEVTYVSGKTNKEMAFNLTDENGVSLKEKKAKKELTPEQKVKLDNRHAAFMKDFNQAILEANFLDCQIQSGNYNINTI